jgi:hypothetical protein
LSTISYFVGACTGRSAVVVWMRITDAGRNIVEG